MAKAKSTTVEREDAPRVTPGGPACVDLDAVLGQDRAVEQLRSAAGANRLHHAWIFAGPVGVGKRTTAEAFAALLLDPSAAPDLTGVPRPEPDSPTQRMLASRGHPDLHFITKELARLSDDARVRAGKQRNIPLAVLQEFLIAPANKAASVREHGVASKVFIIDEAELLRSGQNEGQNALLKTLEEPPAGTVIILVTAREDALLPTIRSRCQRVVFRRLDDEAMHAWFERSGLDISGPERDWVIRSADGSPGAAQLAVETGLFEWWTQLEPMLRSIDRGRYPEDFGPTVAKLIDGWAKDRVAADARTSKEAANHRAASIMLGMLGDHFRARLRDAAAAGDSDAIDRAAMAIDALQHAERHFRSSVSMPIVAETLGAQLVEV
jgi:hypothetical protein